MKRDQTDPPELDDDDDEGIEREGDAAGKTASRDPNQGEGDRASARRYNQHVREFVASGRPAPAARDARDALEGPEGPDLERAEKRAASVARPTVIERVKGLVNRVRHSLERRR